MKGSLVIITIGVSLLVAAGCVHRSQNRPGEAKVAAQILAANVQASLVFGETLQAKSIASSIAEVDQFAFVVILDREGKVFAEYFRPSIQEKSNVLSKLKRNLPNGTSDSLIEEADMIIAIVPVQLDDTPVGYVAVGAKK